MTPALAVQCSLVPDLESFRGVEGRERGWNRLKVEWEGKNRNSSENSFQTFYLWEEQRNSLVGLYMEPKEVYKDT